jgi:sporulation protein YlmC with PRC-barrel domain
MMTRALITTAAIALAAGTADARELAAKPLSAEAYRDGFSAEQLIGRDVAGVEAGGFLDIGDKAIAVPWDQIELTNDGTIRASDVVADNVDRYRVFADRVEDGFEGRPFRADELVDAFVTTADGRDLGIVHDLIFSREGELGGVVVLPDVRYPTASYLAFQFAGGGDGTRFDPAGDTYRVPAMDEEVAVGDPFPYRDGLESGAFAPPAQP